ncbi:MAG: zinc metalloprotease HtpX [Acidobacteriota bacterium]
MNNLKTVILLGLLTGLLIFIGDLAGGRSGMLIALIFAGILNFGSLWFSDKIILSMYKAKEVNSSRFPILHGIVEELSRRAGIPKPKVYLIPSQSPNAFATGRSPRKGAVAVTEGLLKIMEEEELRGVLSHEVSHIKNRDTFVSAVAATLAGAIMFLARQLQWLFLFYGVGDRDRREGGGLGLIFTLILAPIAALLIQMAISRSREYKADESGARISGTPLALASALEKLTLYSKRIPMKVEPSTSHMFIVSPLRGESIFSLFSTHPPVEKRIMKLRELARL